MNLAFDDFNELRALHLTLCEAKFHPDSHRKEIQGSPLVARTANRVYDLLIDNSATQDEAEEWRVHRQLADNYYIFPFIERKACESFDDHPEWTLEDRQRFLADLAAPYSLSEALIERLTQTPGNEDTEQDVDPNA